MIALTNPYAVFVHDDCFVHDVIYDGDNINAKGGICQNKTDTAKECYELCRNTEACLQFTWMAVSIPGREKQCCLKRKISSTASPLSGAISGPKSCGMYSNTIYSIYSVWFFFDPQYLSMLSNQYYRLWLEMLSR